MSSIDVDIVTLTRVYYVCFGVVWGGWRSKLGWIVGRSEEGGSQRTCQIRRLYFVIREFVDNRAWSYTMVLYGDLIRIFPDIYFFNIRSVLYKTLPILYGTYLT